jgi:hypothetical protein
MFDKSKVNAILHDDHVNVFGDRVPFVRRGSDDHFESRDKALKAAQQYGVERLNAIEAKKGRPLTMREVLSGNLEARTDHRPLAERVRAEAVVMRQKEESDENPYRSRIADLESQRPMLRAEREQRASRLAHLKAVADQWDREKALRDAETAYNADPRVMLMREHCKNAMKIAQFDKDITADELRERQELFQLVKSGEIEPKEYHARADAADERTWARQDAQKAALRTTMAEMDSKHAASRALLAELNGGTDASHQELQA